jgi:hypothetical protein
MDTVILDSQTFVGIISIVAGVALALGGALGYYTGVQDRPRPRRRRVGPRS